MSLYLRQVSPTDSAGRPRAQSQSFGSHTSRRAAILYSSTSVRIFPKSAAIFFPTTANVSTQPRRLPVQVPRAYAYPDAAAQPGNVPSDSDMDELWRACARYPPCRRIQSYESTFAGASSKPRLPLQFKPDLWRRRGLGEKRFFFREWRQQRRK